MPSESDIELLRRNHLTTVCESPFELEFEEDGVTSKASGACAELLLAFIQENPHWYREYKGVTMVRQFRVFTNTDGGMAEETVGVDDLLSAVRLIRKSSHSAYGRITDPSAMVSFAKNAEIGDEFSTGNSVFIRVKDKETTEE